MDRSVDSIGSCSLDVDAESTDFSDTSGSLNLPTPSSTKDITREFTSRIKERCQITQINCQQTTTILDPTSGKISTIISTVETSESSPVKKPSYLNLACCVNGYSNLTTYDSKLRQNINKSREVSPIRPSLNTLQYNKGTRNLLAPPVLVQSSNTSPLKDDHYYSFYNMTSPGTTTIENRHDFAQGINTVDNASNANGKFLKAKFISTTLTKKTNTLEKNDTKSSSKSFIQQRVERLYGPGALAQGFYSPKKSRPATNGTEAILCERFPNFQNNNISNHNHNNNNHNLTQQYSKITNSSLVTQNEVNGGSKTTTYHHEQTMTTTSVSAQEGAEDFQNLRNFVVDLPVLRHLRPEFRAQLPIVSPKKSQQMKLLIVVEHGNQNQKTVSPVQVNGGKSQQSQTEQQQYVNGTNSNSIDDNKSKSSSSATITSSSNCSQLSTIHHQNYYSTSPPSTSPPMTPSAEDENGRITVNVLGNTPLHHLHQQKLSTSIADNTIKQIITKTSDTDKGTTTIAPSSNVLSTVNSSIDDDMKISANDNSARNVECDSRQLLVNDKKITCSHNITMPNQENDINRSKRQMDTVDISERDGNYFLHVFKTERDRLIDLAVHVEEEMDLLSDNDVSEEIFGYLRSASGKARLLASQKMQQFEGLCLNNLNQAPDEKFPTTNGDLQGFWDMVMLQVDHIDSLFREIDSLKANGWKKPAPEKPSAPQGAKLTKRSNSNKTAVYNNISIGTSSKKSAAAALAAQKREAQRKQLIELKRKNKMTISAEQQQQESSAQVPNLQENTSQGPNSVEIFVNESCS